MKKDRDEVLAHQLEAIEVELDAVTTQLENVCERIDTQHATLINVLLAILRQTGAELPPELRSAHVPFDDELYERARQAVIEAGKVSTSYLQRRFGIGYSRAASLVDLLEERGVIGPERGSKPRNVLQST